MLLSNLEKRLNIRFRDKSLLRTALTHRSYLNEHPEYKGQSNERLEFLGDAILEFITSLYLFSQYPNLSEGELTAFRSALVSTKNLTQTAKKLNLGQFLFLAKGEEENGGRRNPGILENAVEALIGAIFLDQGLEKAREFVQKHILSTLPEIIRTESYKNPKSQLQEVVQEKYKKPPIYKVLKAEGPDHAKIFTVAVFVGERKMGKGKGKSKQEAEEKAAQEALEKMG